MPVSRLATIKCTPWGPGAGEVGGQWAVVQPSRLSCSVRDGARSFEQGQRMLCADKPQGRISKVRGTKEEKGNCRKQLWSTTTTFNNVQPFWGALDASQECCDGTTWKKAFGAHHSLLQTHSTVSRGLRITARPSSSFFSYPSQAQGRDKS